MLNISWNNIYLCSEKSSETLILIFIDNELVSPIPKKPIHIF